MERIEPDVSLAGLPCSNVAVSCAKREMIAHKTSHTDGYMTMRDMNRFVRDNLKVTKYTYFKRNERPLLKELKLGRAIVCVYGHMIYVENNTYWSFFNNENDEVVAYWNINDTK